MHSLLVFQLVLPLRWQPHRGFQEDRLLRHLLRVAAGLDVLSLAWRDLPIVPT